MSPGEFDVYNCPLQGISLIEASAGTGKTWNICGLYLRFLLERNLDVRQILVVTFTNAATAELRDRIRTRIVETLAILKGDEPIIKDVFAANLISCVGRRTVSSREKMVVQLELALQTFDEASILTIHGFCRRALEDLPFAAGLPFAMELIEDDSEIVLEVVQDFWRRHVAGIKLEPALADALQANKDSPAKLALLIRRKLAKPLAECLWPGDIDLPTDKSREKLAQLHVEMQACWPPRLDEVRELLLAARESLRGNSYTEEAIRRGAYEWEELLAGDGALVDRKSETEKLDLYGTSTLTSKTKKGKTTPSHPFFAQAQRLLDARSIVEREQTLTRLRLIRTLLNQAGARIRERKRERRVMSFDDILQSVHAALQDGRFPELAGSLQARFPVALVDEFQDTDPVQYSIFHTIYRNRRAPIFLVGDPKQSIYRFRNADIYTYLGAKQQAGEHYTLTQNQRSTQGLIVALNALFTRNSQAFMMPGLVYHSSKPGVKHAASLVDKSETRADLQIWKLPQALDGEILRQQSMSAFAVQAVTAEIARVIREGMAHRIILGEKPLCPADIAVLVRTHAEGRQIKKSLSALGISSVELSQDSVFHTIDAEEVDRILAAILEPTRSGLLRAALSTEMLGYAASEIDAMTDDDSLLAEVVDRYVAYRETWLQRGIGFMYRQFLGQEGVSARLLSRVDGERRLTNLLHLGELLHQSAANHTSPDALLRWLQLSRCDENTEEIVQLRLESDRNLVQIVTIHKSKGLQYPFVFCPFLWKGNIVSRKLPGGCREYHHPGLGQVLDFRLDGEVSKDVTDQVKLEECSEAVRLIYVALTRAVYRCYLIAANHRSLLSWLVTNTDQTPQEWLQGSIVAEQIESAWIELADTFAPHIGVESLPLRAGSRVGSGRLSVETLAAATAPRNIGEAWRVSSYSGLSYGAVHDAAATDHDARIDDEDASFFSPAALVDDILGFPRGPKAGDCLHAVFETVDFTRPSSWDAAIHDALIRHPQSLPDLGGGPAQTTILARMLRRMLEDVVDTDLPNGIRLSAIPLSQRLTEFGFSLPCPALSANSLNQALSELGLGGPRLGFPSLHGYLTGFIDLVFEAQGRFYILDWKSNHLGFSATHYVDSALQREMVQHGYHLQYLLYTVALHRYLSGRLPDYQYATHFGGVMYLFVRGVRPAWSSGGKAAGVYFNRPSALTVRRMDTLLAG